MNRAWKVFQRMISRTDGPPPDLEATLSELRTKTPSPVFWLLGKTQSGKSSLIRYLTGAEAAVIGSGFQPCTKTTRQFEFPSAEAPLLAFLDTRGVDEPGYDPHDDITTIDPLAHVVIVTAKATDFAQGNIRAALEQIREANPSRPVLLVITCLNEAIPRQPHPQPYPFSPLLHHGPMPEEVPEPLRRAIDEHRSAFGGLFDACAAIDLTRPEDGFQDPNYGGEYLKQALLEMLPAAYRQTLLRLKEATDTLKDMHLQHAIPLIQGYASMAATAGAIPIPFVDLLIIPGIQGKMVTQLATIYGQPLTGERFKEIAASLGIGLVTRQAVREVVKFIPYLGSVAGAAVAWASTYALGRAFCHYYQAVCEGHVPDPQSLKQYYAEQFAIAEKEWKVSKTE